MRRKMSSALPGGCGWKNALLEFAVDRELVPAPALLAKQQLLASVQEYEGCAGLR